MWVTSRASNFPSGNRSEPEQEMTTAHEMVRCRNQQGALYKYEDDEYKPEVVKAGHWWMENQRW